MLNRIRVHPEPIIRCVCRIAVFTRQHFAIRRPATRRRFHVTMGWSLHFREKAPTAWAGEEIHALFPKLNQSALAEIPEISAGGTLDHIDGKFEQANFPGIIDSLNDRAQRFVRIFYAPFGAVDYGSD